MRNPFRRQTETAAPSLRDRAADLSARLAGTTRRPEPAATAEGTFAPAPAALADACRWAVQHRAWVDFALKVTDWPEEKFDAETGKTNAVITRAINEPSTHLSEIVAKAALALDDFERFTMALPREPDDGARIVHTVLREIASFNATAITERAPPDLLGAARLSVEAMPVSDLSTIIDVAEALSSVASAFVCQPRQMTKDNFNGAGLLIESVAVALHRVIEIAARELRGRAPADASDKADRLAALARLTIHNDDPAETAAFARELLALVEH